MKQRLKILIADDEAPARDRLRTLLERLDEVTVVGEARDGDEVLDLIRQEKPDAVLLDIRMPGLSGLDIAEMLANERASMGIIFVTAYDEHAVQAFDLDADDYIPKPVRPSRLERALARVREKLSDQRNPVDTDRIALPLKHRIEFIRVADICYAQFKYGTIELQCVDRLHHLAWNLTQLAEKLSTYPQIIKVSRQAMVNFDHVERMEFSDTGTGVLFLDNGARVDVSRSAARMLRTRFE